MPGDALGPVMAQEHIKRPCNAQQPVHVEGAYVVGTAHGAGIVWRALKVALHAEGSNISKAFVAMSPFEGKDDQVRICSEGGLLCIPHISSSLGNRYHKCGGD